ncbi:tyrosine-type recombinase/integrase [Mobiluncus mulieris]|uniref:Site-specific recombinase, phage integrase family n=3 Tax=Mobiluncus mulieris TaxID=2052 RepID=E0QPR0_9ACTO|nr:tyrosine-type recombinase/integrase [Mobiluncus mulieris]EFM46480.1 site-specific recombinase, phage integrase family [Mobiluncus mulieris ATCC 35239]MCU9969290.1 tyrosine-type recombinase/integrase [Mobiluncus mulieris]MCU9970487.1 tyrosine-type recombinase/integrase [Mobiluncus mulieris]MCU9973771.1 tyrosine-type recombinase/integrase [Mobiluncus mulieris]MCU9993192.1 tyrosine-type recombinase/integrase [Mobiluncus mulieris]
METRKTWPGATSAYLRHLKAAGRSPGTIRIHRYYMGLLAGIAPCPAHVTTERLEVWLSEHDWQPETRRSAQGVASTFFKYLVREEIVKKDPTLGLAPVHVPDGVPRPAPEAAVRHALANAPDRTALMVRFAAFCGLRACEIAKLRGSDWDGELLRVKGKGGRVRIIPVQDRTLIYHLEQCPGWLFPGRIDGHLSAQYTAKLLGEYLPAGVTGHALRHRFGTVAYRATHDLLAVGAVMGHAKTDTTKRYIQLDLDPLMRAVAAAQCA